MTKRERFDLWATHQELEGAARAVNAALGLNLEERESEFRGIYFGTPVGSAIEVLVQKNHLDDEVEALEAEFADYPTLVYVNPSSDAIESALASVGSLQLVRSEVL